MRHPMIFVLLIACSSIIAADQDSPRPFSISLMDFPVDKISSYSISAGKAKITKPIFTGQSRTKEGVFHTHYLHIPVPEKISFNIVLNDGTAIRAEKSIDPATRNRFGLCEAILCKNKDSFEVKTKYGSIHEENPEITWDFKENGDLERVWISEVLEVGRVSTNVESTVGGMSVTMRSCVHEGRPLVYVRYGSDGAISEVEVYHRDDPKGYRIFYSSALRPVKATYEEVEYHPGGLRKAVKNVEIQNPAEIAGKFKSPDIGFLTLSQVSIKDELKKRGITTGSSDGKSVIENAPIK